jgi:D-inositol-3-phosphate glycosyltransferase
MISFVWSSRYPFIAGSGGSENYTAGHIRELQRRNIPCRILTLGHGRHDGRDDFPDIEFKALKSAKELETLDDTIVFITYALDVKTKKTSYVILHCPPPDYKYDPHHNIPALAGKKLIATSRFASKMWARYYAKVSRKIPLVSIVYPFADPPFAGVKRPNHKGAKTRILFAGRLIHDKGIYTLLTALHLKPMRDLNYKLTVTTAGSNDENGRLIKKLLEVHPWINLLPAKRSPKAMAQLMANHDIVVMPTTNIFWRESFGIVSVEAQHAGCRTVVSKSGGLPETSCGGLIVTKADDPLALANGIVRAAELGPLTEAERNRAVQKFTVQKSVDSLLEVIRYGYGQPPKQPRHQGDKFAGLHHQLPLFSSRSKR